MRLQPVLMTLLVVLVAATIGCERPRSIDSGPMNEPSAWDDALADRARLIDALPADTMAYLRLPGIWGMFSAPKSSALGAGLDTPANREAISALQARLPEVLAADLGQLAPLLTLLLESLRSPLEFALVGDGPQPLEADLVIEGRFDFDTVAELDAALAELTGQAALLQLLEPAEGDGPGQILATMFPIFYDFDATTRRARFLTGMGASAERLEASYQWQSPTGTLPMQVYEQQIDASRFGFYLWADMARLGPLMRQGLDPQQLAQFEALGVFATRQLALGYGSSDGKARLALLAEGRQGRAWELTLPPAAPIGIDSSGEPRVVAGLRVPDSDWLQQLAAIMGGESETELSEISAHLEAEIGLDLNAVLDSFAGRMIFIDDDNGGYLVHDAASIEHWTAFWDALAQRFEIRQAIIQAGGTDIHHLTIPGISLDEEMGSLSAANPALSFVLGRLMRIGTHLFWMREDDRILIAAVPQVLMARLDHPGNVAVGQWLADAGMTTDRAALFGALGVDGAPRRNYYGYISSLLSLADMLDIRIDVADFPTARELALPEAGTVGFAIDYADGQLGVRLTFENHPGDLLYAGGGSLVGVAAVGILAAVAVPAYQDYQMRAKLGSAFSATAQFRRQMAAYQFEHGRIPEPALADEWVSAVAFGPDVVNAVWQTEPAGLVLILDGDSGLGENAKFMISPRIEDGQLAGWQCSSSTIADKHLPSSCR
ncbi:MAG: pilin [Pseudomonadota bacterium]|nr:MAG: pilin [Pseudomonadota bacterium]